MTTPPDAAMEEAVRIVEEHHLLYEPRVDIAVVRKQLGYSIASALRQRDQKISKLNTELQSVHELASSCLREQSSQENHDLRVTSELRGKLAEQEKVIAELRQSVAACEKAVRMLVEKLRIAMRWGLKWNITPGFVSDIGSVFSDPLVRKILDDKC